MRSLFSRITRYPPTAAIDPRENRLTEAFAAVLERTEGLAAALVAHLAISGEPDRRPWVRTQRPTTGGRYIDLELGFGAVAAPDLRIWIEVKHGSGLGELQIENYVEDVQGEAHGRSAIVLLAPRQSYPEGGEGAIRITWQSLARFLVEWARTHPGQGPGQWLLKEFLLYLKEQGLMDDELLTTGHAFALSEWPAADRAISRVVEVARPLIDATWGTPNDFAKKGKTATTGLGWWSTYPAGDGTTFGPAWFEWSLRADEIRAEPRSSIAFFAGITFGSAKTAPFANPANGGWIATVAAAGFERVQPWYWALWRPFYPEELLAAKTIEAQAAQLAEWVLASFRFLSEAPPPA